MANEYRKLQIVKHALQFYTQREGASEKDYEQEMHLLNEVEDMIEDFKKKNGIGGNNK